MHSGFWRVYRVTIGVLATSVLSVGVLSAPVAAMPSPPIGPCDPGTRWYSVDGKPAFTLTHVTGYQAPPGGNVTVTRTAELVRTLTASVEAGLEGKFSAGAILAKVETKYNIKLAASGTQTKRTAESLSYQVTASKEDRYYAIYSGRREWAGMWRLRECARDGQSDRVIESGDWTSFQSNIEGGALCPAARYKETSLPYKACKETWD